MWNHGIMELWNNRIMGSQSPGITEYPELEMIQRVEPSLYHTTPSFPAL